MTDQLPDQLIGNAVLQSKALIIFDTQTTGLSHEKDQIIQLALATYLNGTRVGPVQVYRFRPTVATISEEARALHGISMEDLQEEEPFKHYARTIRNTMTEAAALMAYHIRFDIHLLQNEFTRAGLKKLRLDQVSLFDPYVIWMTLAPRRLFNAHEVFVGEPMPTTYDAEAHIIATAHVYNAMLQHFDLVDETAQNLDRMVRGNNNNAIDLDEKFVWNAEGQVVFNFGKFKGQDVLNDDVISYLEWMLREEFQPGAQRIAQCALAVHLSDLQPVQFKDIVVKEFGGPPMTANQIE